MVLPPMNTAESLYIGIMSGTSMDGIDAVLAAFPTKGRGYLLNSISLPFPSTLRQDLLSLNHASSNELERAALASQELSQLYAHATIQLLAKQRINSAAVTAIGVHGQTVRHRPELGYTIQLNAPALLAELTAIDVVADFRSRDIAAGGQGAPLVPPVHRALFGHDRIARVVANLGGIANITVLHPKRRLLGFDTGPANMLMDAWVQRHLQKSYDHDGLWARSGQVLPLLLEALMAEAWLQQPPPKSTGRDLFNAAWLEQKVYTYSPSAKAQDVQATLLEFSALSLSNAIMQHAEGTEEIIVCGGGAVNAAYTSRIQALSQLPVISSATLGIDPQHVEAFAFAWLAYAHVNRIYNNAPEVTGARRPAILGAYYPA